MKLNLAFSALAIFVHAAVTATPVDRQIDAPRSRIAPNKMAVLGGPKSAATNRLTINGKTTNHSVQRGKNSALKAPHA